MGAGTRPLLLEVDSTAAVNALVVWAVAESGLNPQHVGAHFNPCNTTWKTHTSTQFNSAGVQNYASYEAGLHAWNETIQLEYYSALRHQFRWDLGGRLAIIEAIIASPWGTKHIPESFNPDWADFAPLNLQAATPDSLSP